MPLAMVVASKMPLFFMSLCIMVYEVSVPNVKEIGLNLDYAGSKTRLHLIENVNLKLFFWEG